MENDAITIMTAMINASGGIVEVPLRIAGELTADALKNIISVLWYALKQVNHNIQLSQNVGICDMQTLMKKKGTELQYCRIREDIKEDFFNDLKNRGCMFTVLPDLNLEDGYKEIAFHATDTPKVNASCRKFKVGMLNDSDVPEGIIGFDSYINNGTSEILSGIKNEYAEELKKQDAPGEYTFSLNKETLLAGEDPEKYYFFLPSTRHQELIIINRSDCTEIQDGAAIESTLKLSNTYAVYDGTAYTGQNELNKTKDLSGDELSRYFNHQREMSEDVPRQNKPSEQKLTPETLTPETEYLKKVQDRSFGKRAFKEDQIFDETTSYYFVTLPEDQILAVPKTDVAMHQDDAYTFELKNKPYQIFHTKEFIEYDMGGPAPKPTVISKTEIRKYLKDPTDTVTKESVERTIKKAAEVFDKAKNRGVKP